MPDKLGQRGKNFKQADPANHLWETNLKELNMNIAWNPVKY